VSGVWQHYEPPAGELVGDLATSGRDDHTVLFSSNDERGCGDLAKQRTEILIVESQLGVHVDALAAQQGSGGDLGRFIAHEAESPGAHE
jgi:hypothetical protein